MTTTTAMTAAIDIFELPVFPPADIFPMMSEDELEELAADIAKNGLRDPLVIGTVDKVEMLVDGRNRRVACKIAGVEPSTRHLNGEDPTAFVLSANIHRRHLTAGQRAMAVAMIYPEPEQTAPGKRAKSTTLFPEKSVSAVGLSKARAVLQYAPTLAHGVLTGGSLNDAYAKALDAKKAAESEEARLAEMRTEAPDIADLVGQDRMRFPEAWAAFEKRRSDAAASEASKRETLLRHSEAAYRGVVALANAEFVEAVRVRLGDDDFRREFIERLRPMPEEVAAINQGAAHLIAILKGV